MKPRRYEELRKLKGRITERGETYRTLSRKINIETATFSNKINGFSSFNSDEIYALVEALSIADHEVTLYFFSRMLQNATDLGRPKNLGSSA